MKRIVRLVLAASVLSCSVGILHAEEDLRPKALAHNVIYEIKTGLLAHDVDHLWSGSRQENGADFNVELILAKPHWTLLKGVVRPNLGASINAGGDTSKIYGGVVYEVGIASWFLSLGLGATWHNGATDTKAANQKSLGARVLFRIPMELGLSLTEHHRISIMFDHISNAYLADPNQGLDTIGLRYGYRF